ncbi:transcriptional regulator, BadM/Rrf2 family protein [Corynebacterium xerosis]|uniref:Transcriptional regulator, BadM/Rrf2 family protein n=1 Tax=Corynebacterium xerosis TaxID=1725 RepID=A0A2N6SXU7_9CORY|nr:Rrf2 family transcriptional regulator [Corynebacterium xerosis]PMC61856.1 transcriptional regulator, BadM/Rrf2 family protein [Corynebacterium xerosis]
MQLTVFSDLSLRIIMRMAAGEPGQKFTAGTVADELNASRAHVAKVVTRLVELDLVVAVKGRYGGIYLADGALEKSVGAILRELESGEVVDCVGTNCPLLPACRLRTALANAQEAFFAHLDPITIGELVGDSADRDAPRHLLKLIATT